MTEKNNQVRKRPMVHDIYSDWDTETEDQKTRVDAPLRRPNTIPKVLSGRKRKFPLVN